MSNAALIAVSEIALTDLAVCPADTFIGTSVDVAGGATKIVATGVVIAG